MSADIAHVMSTLGFPHELHTAGQATVEFLKERETYTVVAAVKAPTTPRIFVGHYRLLKDANEAVRKASRNRVPGIIFVEFVDRPERKKTSTQKKEVASC